MIRVATSLQPRCAFKVSVTRVMLASGGGPRFPPPLRPNKRVASIIKASKGLGFRV